MSGWYSNSIHDREAHAGVSVKIPNNNPDGSKTILNGLIKGTVTRKQLKRNILKMRKYIIQSITILIAYHICQSLKKKK